MSSISGVSQGQILVTGAAGFIGSRFVESCHARGISVISVDHPDYFRDRTEHAAISPGKIVDREKLFDWLNQERPSLRAIIHLGACANTMQLDEAFLRRVNIEYSQKLWDFATEHRIPFVYASSAATYGDGALGYDDDEAQIPRLKALNPYGESKRLFDLWALEQEKRGHQPPIWSGFKFFNVYGFGERHKAGMASVVLHAFDQIRKDGKVRLFMSYRDGFGHGEQKRDFVSVEDVVSVLNFAWQGSDGKGPLKRGIYNLGTGRAQSFLDLARAVFKAMGARENIEYIEMPETIRDRYQYFTEAKMDRLKAQGYTRAFANLETGAAQYIRRLMDSSKS